MDNFFDTNVIFNYSNSTPFSKEIIKKCYFYITNKKERFIVCWAVLKELSEITKKRAILHKAVVNKIKNPSYPLESSISAKDIPYVKKLYENFKNRKANEISFKFTKERSLSEAKIQIFLNSLVDEKVIPIEQIDNNLVNQIHDIISNHADCKIIASALQFMKQRKEDFLFVTADGEHLDPNGYDYLKEEPKLKDYQFPKLKNLCFED